MKSISYRLKALEILLKSIKIIREWHNKPLDYMPTTFNEIVEVLRAYTIIDCYPKLRNILIRLHII